MYHAGLQLFCSVRGETRRLAEGLTQEQAEFAPAPRKWSVGEILDHLLLSEGIYREKFRQLIMLHKAGRTAVVRSSFGEIDTSVLFIPKSILPLLNVPFSIFNLFVPPFVREIMTQYPLMPAQNPDSATPRKGRSVAELHSELESSLKETQALFEANPDLDYRRMRFSHPLLGDNHALQVLRILALHERRHQSQIRGVFKTNGFPNGN
jgi:hypothetical protein